MFALSPLCALLLVVDIRSGNSSPPGLNSTTSDGPFVSCGYMMRGPGMPCPFFFSSVPECATTSYRLALQLRIGLATKNMPRFPGRPTALIYDERVMTLAWLIWTVSAPAAHRGAPLPFFFPGLRSRRSWVLRCPCTLARFSTVYYYRLTSLGYLVELVSADWWKESLRPESARPSSHRITHPNRGFGTTV